MPESGIKYTALGLYFINTTKMSTHSIAACDTR